MQNNCSFHLRQLARYGFVEEAGGGKGLRSTAGGLRLGRDPGCVDRLEPAVSGAAYRLVTLIFQDGRLQGLLGYTSFVAITWRVPLFMFVLLFGISMDCHVFILSRIRELWTRGSPAREAVVGGIASSAGVVTSAALIMVAVFSIFLTLPLIELKVIGDRAWRLRRRCCPAERTGSGTGHDR